MPGLVYRCNFILFYLSFAISYSYGILKFVDKDQSVVAILQFYFFRPRTILYIVGRNFREKIPEGDQLWRPGREPRCLGYDPPRRC